MKVDAVFYVRKGPALGILNLVVVVVVVVEMMVVG